MDYYMKATFIFCLLSLATASPPSQQEFGICSQIYTMHQYCTSQMSPASTGRVNYTAIGEKIAAKFFDLKARSDESFERLEGSIVKRLESGDAVIERVRYETAESSNKERKSVLEGMLLKHAAKCLESKIDEKIERFVRIVNRQLKRGNVKIEEIRNETGKGINETRTDLEAKIDEKFEGMKGIVVARLEKVDTEIEKIQNETTKNSKTSEETLANLEARIDEKFEGMKGIVAARLEKGDTEIEKIQNETTKNSKTSEETLARTIWPSCDDVPRSNHESRGGKSGIFNIIQSVTLYNVYCDMTTEGGGWTVFQRRMDGSVDFYRDWEDYATGFGYKSGEFWLGLETVHQLTQDGAYELRVDLTDWDGSTAYAEYGTFSISGRSDNYRLNIGEYSGTAGFDSLEYHDNRPFSAKNKDLDDWSDGSCATTHHAAWWFGTSNLDVWWYPATNCTHSSLNGRYNDTSGDERGVYWYHWKHRNPYSLKASEMKFRKK